MPTLWWRLDLAKWPSCRLLTCAWPSTPVVLRTWQGLSLWRREPSSQLPHSPASGLWGINFIVVFLLLCILHPVSPWNDYVLPKWRGKNNPSSVAEHFNSLECFFWMRGWEHMPTFSPSCSSSKICHLFCNWREIFTMSSRAPQIPVTVLFKVGILNIFTNSLISVLFTWKIFFLSLHSHPINVFCSEVGFFR